MPKQIAIGGVEGLDNIAVAGDEHHAVMHQRRRLGGADRQRPGPDRHQAFDIGLGDLLKRAEARAVARAAPAQPIAIRRRGQHCFADRRNLVERIGNRRGVGRQFDVRGEHRKATNMPRQAHLPGIFCCQIILCRRNGIGLQDVGHDVDVIVLAKRTGRAFGHIVVDIVAQIADRLSAPMGQKIAALERGRKLAVIKGRTMAGLAILRVGRLAGGCLRRAVAGTDLRPRAHIKHSRRESAENQTR